MKHHKMILVCLGAPRQRWGGGGGGGGGGGLASSQALVYTGRVLERMR